MDFYFKKEGVLKTAPKKSVEAGFRDTPSAVGGAI